MARFINPLFVNNLIDANIVDHVASGTWEPIRQILELHASGEIQLIMPHSVRTELLRQTTPAEIRAAATDFIFTIPVSLTAEERTERDRLLQRARGNAKLMNIAADLSHIAEAAKYGGYFITLDKRLLKRAAVISDEFVSIEVVTPERFLEKVAEAKKMMANPAPPMGYERNGKCIQGIGSIFQKLEKNENVRETRKAIADLMMDCLKSLKDSLGYWEKEAFALAIRYFRCNVNSLPQPTNFWLRACIVSLERALVPPAERDENYIPRDKQIDSLTYEQLMEEIKSIQKSHR